MTKKPKAPSAQLKSSPSAPPKTPLARTKVVGGVAAAAVGKKLKSEMQAVFLPASAREQHRAQTRDEIARLVFEGLSKLRGTALKLAQVFCADTGLLPEEYLRTFEQSHYRVPGLSVPLVRGVLRRELKREPEEIFAEFDWHPAAAASLGQVHRARLKTGESVAVKVQYPGMQESLRADMRMARVALKPLLRTGLILSMLEQLEARLEEEIDYRRELENLNTFSEQALSSGLILPQAFPQWSSARVLTMQWIDGVTLDMWAKGMPEQADRDAKAQMLFQFFLQGVFERHCFHSDANFGNFLVTPEGRLAILDFGAVTRLPAGEAAFYARLWQHAGQNEALVRGYQERGADTGQGFWDTCVQPYLNWMDSVLSIPQFDFGKNPDVVARGYELFSAQMMNPQLQNYRDHLPLAHRTLLGLFSIFLRLSARIDTQPACAMASALARSSG